MTEASDGSPAAEESSTSKVAEALSVGDIIITDESKRLRVDAVETVKPGKHAAAKVVVRTTDTTTGAQRELSYLPAQLVRIVGS
ncbi:hypothetical protein [Nocardia altamirensis]|uniref:hypothetical protein n=1 Tax=Nocardia altamirensis TaxID=472158 RepID=UPI0008405EB2|nr:hypothetical protein [Nocardia altamirensis]